MFIPTFLAAQSAAFLEILKLSETNPNDMDFGKKARAIVNEYAKPKSTCNYVLDQEFIDTPKVEREENDGDFGPM